MYVALEDDDITYDFVRGLGSYDTLLETQKKHRLQSTVGHFRKFPALENFSCWKFTRWKSVAGNAGKMEKF